MKHPIPRWTFIITPLSLASMIFTPWAEIAAQSPEATPLALVLVSVGMALVCISITHWVKALGARHE